MTSHPVTLLALGDVTATGPLLALGGLVCMAALLALRVPGAILLGILGGSVGAWLLGAAAPPESLVSVPQLPRETLFALDLGSVLSGELLLVVVALLFVDLFDTTGTLLGVGRLAGALDEEDRLPRADRAFAADAVGTMVGALLGTSTVTSYVESATGVEEGGRTGLVAVFVALFFLLSLFFTPLLIAVPASATAPALILVGALMMRGATDVDWHDVGEALPAFLTITLMPFSYSIANGIAAGILSWVALKALRGRWREIHPLMALLALALALFYAFRPGG